MSLRDEVLRKLVTDYQLTNDGVTFSKILKRVDRLLLKTIHIHVKCRPHLMKVDLRDLYHSAIVGLGRAILTAKDDETGYKLIARIIAYVKSGLSTDYPLNTMWKYFTFVSLEDVVDFSRVKDREVQTMLDIETNAELSIMFDEYIDMLVYDYISVEDINILIMRYGKSMNYREIALVIHTSEQNVRERANRILKMVQEWFKDFEL